MNFVHGWKSIGLLFGNYSINFATDCAYLLKSTKSFSIDCLLRIQCRNYFEISEMESDCDLCVMISAQNAKMHLFKYTMNDNRWAFLLPRNTCSFFSWNYGKKSFMSIIHVHHQSFIRLLCKKNVYRVYFSIQFSEHWTVDKKLFWLINWSELKIVVNSQFNINRRKSVCNPRHLDYHWFTLNCNR